MAYLRAPEPAASRPTKSLRNLTPPGFVELMQCACSPWLEFAPLDGQGTVSPNRPLVRCVLKKWRTYRPRSGQHLLPSYSDLDCKTSPKMLTNIQVRPSLCDPPSAWFVTSTLNAKPPDAHFRFTMHVEYPANGIYFWQRVAAGISRTLLVP